MIETLPAFLSFVVGVLVLLTDVEESCVFASIGTRCRIDAETHGVCVIKEDCAAYMNLYTSLLTIENINFLRALQCENILFPDETIVCCPHNTSEYRNPSVFIDLDSLPKITESEADAAINDTIFQHLSDLNERNILNMMDINTFIDRLDHEVDDENLLPRKFECGDGAQFVNRVFGGDFTSISEFPWMALLIYNTNSSRPFGCCGSLINHRYVLTAAHCVSGKLYESKCGLRSVRFGEYNIETEEDCMPSRIPSGHILKCADPVVEVGVEKIIVHPDYNDKSRDKMHDIALLRLNTNVTYSKYIKPICLPVAGLSSGLITGNKQSVAGWGSTNVFKRYGDVSSSIKLKVRLPITDMTDCRNAYTAYNVNLGPGQVCAGGMKAKDSCLGDSGGPLMYFDRNNSAWIASGNGIDLLTISQALCLFGKINFSQFDLGIVSFGAEKCGTVGLPGVYTKVEHYLSWIMDNLEK